MSELRRGSEVPIVKCACFELFYMYLVRTYWINSNDCKDVIIGDHIMTMCKKTNIEKLNKLSWRYRWTLINRMLFFMVLEDEFLIHNGVHGNEERLLDVFDGFTIYPNGITECDIFESRGCDIFATLNFCDRNSGISYKLDDENLLTERFMKTTYKVAEKYDERISRCVGKINRLMMIYSTESLSIVTKELSLYKLCHSRCDDGDRFIYGDASKLLLNVVNGSEQELTLGMLMGEYLKIRDTKL